MFSADERITSKKARNHAANFTIEELELSTLKNNIREMIRDMEETKKIQKETLQLLREKLWFSHECHLSPDDGCECVLKEYHPMFWDYREDCHE